MYCITNRVFYLSVFCGLCSFSIQLGEASNLDCTCWDELNSTAKESTTQLDNNVQLKQMYTYIGIHYNPDNGASPQSCICTDVLRMKSDVTLMTENTSISTRTFSANDQEELGKIFKNLVMSADGGGNFVDIVTTVNHNATSEDVTTSNRTTWTIEVIVKGRRTLSSDQVTNIFKDKLNTETARNELNKFGRFLENETSFSVIQCLEEPPSAPPNGQRTWVDTVRFPPDRATYECNEGHVFPGAMEVQAECSHSNLSWTINTSNLTCIKGCKGEPPIGPYFTVRDWTPYSEKTEGSLVNYSCMRGYKSVNGNDGFSKCFNSEWTDVEDDFKCEQVLCPKAIPQVPAHGRSDWDKTTRFIDTVIKYHCMDGYSSTETEPVSTVCLANGEWSILPQGFRCVNEDYAIRMGIYNDRHIRNYDYYEDGPEVESRTTEGSWFWVVTIPSIIALVMTIFCCMVCTRTDSPLFLLCTGNTKNTDYIPQ